MPIRMLVPLATVVLPLLAAVAVAASGPSAAPRGARLPSVKGNSLDGSTVRLPEDLRGAPALLLVAYRRGTQEDVDRWLGWASTNAPGLKCLEVPAISSLVWRPLASWIDGGMRRGVPQAQWSSVVTLYDDAPVLREFLGDFGGYNTHAVLLDDAGQVAWFHAGGFSEGAAKDLAEALASLPSPPSAVRRLP